MEESAVTGPSGAQSHRYVSTTNTNGRVNSLPVSRTYYKSLLYPRQNKLFFVCCPLSDENELTETIWMLDSGVSMHFMNNINNFVEFEAIQDLTVHTATGTTQITGKGSVIFSVGKEQVRLYPVYYVPELTTRLLSLGQFHCSSLNLRGSARKITLHGPDGQMFLTFIPRTKTSTIYVPRSLLPGKVDYNLSIHVIDFKVMHHCLTHPSLEVLRKAGKYVKGFPDINIPSEHFCPSCAQGKMTQKAFPPSKTRANEPFEIIHSDLQTYPVELYRKFKYCIVFLDDYTSYTWTINLRTKDAALPATCHFLAMVKNQYSTTVKSWMSDAGGEYTSMAFTTLLKEKGIQILQSVPHAHQQNGHTERVNQTLREKAESLRLQACLPQSWWEFALDHATHVYNRTPMKRLEWCPPLEWLSSVRLSVDHLRILGCTAYVFIPAKTHANKLSPKSELITYLGTAPGGKGWMFMCRPNNIIFTTTQAIFDVSMFPKCPLMKLHANTRLQTPVPMPMTCPDGNCNCQGSPGDDDPLPLKASRQRRFTKEEKGKACDNGNLSTSSSPSRSPSLVEVEPPTSLVPPPQPPVMRRSGQAHKIPKKLGNVYGNKHPVQIEKDILQKLDWSWIVGKQSSCP